MPKDFEAFGRAALLPGMQHMIDEMQAYLDQFRERIAEMSAPAKRGRPAKFLSLAEAVRETPAGPSATPAAQHARRKYWAKKGMEPPPLKQKTGGYWAKLTPEERAIEIRRRQAVSRGEAPSTRGAATARELAKLHPRDARSPRHATWLANLRKARQAQVAAMTPKQRKGLAARMHTAKALKKAKSVREARQQSPTVKMQALNGVEVTA